MRDLETIEYAIKIAESGHLVLGTLHADSTSDTPSRIIDVFPSDRQAEKKVQLSSCLKSIIYQRLIPSTK